MYTKMSLKKNGNSPITLEQLAAKSIKIHGKTIWIDEVAHQYDHQTKKVLTVQEFAELQKVRRSREPRPRRRPEGLNGGWPEEDPGPMPVPYAAPSPSVVPGPIDFKKFDPSVARNGHSLR